MSGERSFQLDGDRLLVLCDGRAIASGRWRAGRVENRTGRPSDTGTAHDGWDAVERAVRAQADDVVRATVSAAYDARGVDLTQVDRMLSMTPGERLAAHDAHRRSMLRLIGHAPRE